LKNCEVCEIQFYNYNSVKTCSKSCSIKYRERILTDEQKIKRSKNISESQKISAIEGRHKGFPSRKDNKPSWAEQYFINRFTSDKINFQRDFKINRYFGDFVFQEKRVVLEIDGNTHTFPEIIEKDKIRDKIMIDLGWNVYRIKWKHRDLEYLDNEYKKFLSFIDS
jgi:very-short-patch-repair endonuclease